MNITTITESVASALRAVLSPSPKFRDDTEAEANILDLQIDLWEIRKQHPLTRQDWENKPYQHETGMIVGTDNFCWMSRLAGAIAWNLGCAAVLLPILPHTFEVVVIGRNSEEANIAARAVVDTAQFVMRHVKALTRYYRTIGVNGKDAAQEADEAGAEMTAGIIDTLNTFPEYRVEVPAFIESYVRKRTTTDCAYQS